MLKQRSMCFLPTAERPFWSKAAVIVHDANMGTLALLAEPLRGVDREVHCRLSAGARTQFANFVIDHPRVVVPHNIVACIAMIFSLE